MRRAGLGTVLPSEQEVEAAARAICEHFGAASPDMKSGGKPYWMIYEPAARAALEAAERVREAERPTV